jgi:hypothetical protein
MNNGFNISGLRVEEKYFTIGTIAHSPLASTTYYFGGPAQQPVTGAIQLRRKVYLYEPVIITGCEIGMNGTSGGGTTESFSIYIQVNGTDDYLIQTNNFVTGSFTCEFRNTKMSVKLGPTDWFVFKLVCPAWVVAPANVYYYGKMIYNVMR